VKFAVESNVLKPLDIGSWHGPITPEVRTIAVDALEAGKILYAPKLRFELSYAERRALAPKCLDGKSKNVSFDAEAEVLRGTRCQGIELAELTRVMKRYQTRASDFIAALCPAYAGHLTAGLTSFRPIEIAGSGTSSRRDDHRLHVDAFPSLPLQGARILRIFSNINPLAHRIWHVGEDFEKAVARFMPRVRRPLPGEFSLLSFLRVVTGRRSEYDHYMLGIHDRMKADRNYQAQVSQTEIAFPPGATWICFTDSVSHAPISGQFAFEQTFYLPVTAMKDPERSPLRILERLAGRPLADATPRSAIAQAAP
jgi:hypothetical protein